MLFSHNPAFLFIHIDKVAGASIARALQPYAKPMTRSRWRKRLMLLGPLNRFGLHRFLAFPTHTTASEAQRCLPREVFDRMFKFAFVRNPWDRLVSRYCYLSGKTAHHRHAMVSRMKNFEEFVRWETSSRKGFQYSFVTDSAHRCLVDFIGRYERLQEDFGRICTRLGVRPDLPHANASVHPDYRSFYTPNTRERVALHFQKDIELFGYDFDGPTKDHLLCGLAPLSAVDTTREGKQL